MYNYVYASYLKNLFSDGFRSFGSPSSPQPSPFSELDISGTVRNGLIGKAIVGYLCGFTVLDVGLGRRQGRLKGRRNQQLERHGTKDRQALLVSTEGFCFDIFEGHSRTSQVRPCLHTCFLTT